MPLRAIKPLFSHSLVRDLGRMPRDEPHPTCSEVGSRLTSEPSKTPIQRLAWPPNHVNHDKRPISDGEGPSSEAGSCAAHLAFEAPTMRRQSGATCSMALRHSGVRVAAVSMARPMVDDSRVAAVGGSATCLRDLL